MQKRVAERRHYAIDFATCRATDAAILSGTCDETYLATYLATNRATRVATCDATYFATCDAVKQTQERLKKCKKP